MSAGNKSTLKVEVISTGVAKTVQQLDSLGYAAERNEKKVRTLTGSIKNLMNVQEAAAYKASQHSNIMSAIANAMHEVSKVADATARQVGALSKHMGTLVTATDHASNSFERKARTGGVVNTTLRAMATAASAYLSLNFAKGIVASADGWAMMQAKLKLATGSMSEAKNVQADLFDMAQKLRVPMEDAAKLYTRMAVPMQRMGKSSKETAEQVEFVSLALKLGGATAAEASSVMLQYSQAVNAGRLNGAEFNAVSEAAPGILRAIEAELRATGEWSEASGKSLKKMGADGEITFDLIRRAAVRALPAMRKDFEELPLTVDGAIQRVKNAWFKAMGEMGEDTEMGKKLAKAVGDIEKSIPAIRDALAQTFLFLHDNFDLIKNSLIMLVGIKFIGWLGGAAKGMADLWNVGSKVVGALAGTSAAAGTAATGMGLIARAATALAGPIGIGITAITTLASLWTLFGEKAPKAEAEATAATKIGTVDRVALIQKEIDKLNERNKLAEKGTPATTSATTPDDIASQLRLLETLRKSQQSASSDAVKAGLQVTIDLRQAELERMLQQQQTLTVVKKTNEELDRQAKIKGIVAGLEEKHANNATKANEAVKKAREELEKYGAKLSPELEKLIRDDIDKPKKGDQVDHYAKVRAEVTATNKELKLQLEQSTKLTASEKLRNDLKSGKDTDYNKLKAGQRGMIDAVIEQNIALEKETELRADNVRARKEALDFIDQHQKKVTSETASIVEQTAKIREQTLAITDSKAASKNAEADRITKEADTMQVNAGLDYQDSNDEQQYKAIMDKVQATRDLATATRDLASAQADKTGMEALDKLLDPKKANAFGDSLEKAFGKAGDALGKMTKALDNYGDREDAIAKAREKVMDMDDGEKKTKALIELNKLEAKSKIRAAGDMAGAMKGFFKEHTAGYKIMSGVEKTFRAIELAETLKNNAAKLGGVWTYITAKGAEIGAMFTGLAVDASTTQGHVALSAEKTVASTTAGVAKAFEQMGVYGFIGAAAILAFMAAVGFSGGGGGGGNIGFKERQEKQGTGGVLGDEGAKSESVTNALDELNNNADVSLRYTSQMLHALQSINNGISNMARFVAQGVGMRGTALDEQRFGVGSSKSALGFSKSSTEITDAGIQFGHGQTVGSMAMSGADARSYTDIHKKESSWWGLSSSESRETSLGNLDSSLLEQISLTVADFQNGIAAAGEALGRSGEDIKNQLNTFGINIDRISLKGLSGEDISAELEAVFGRLGDDMARSVISGFDDFQRVGEGYFETVVRVASGLEVGQAALQRIGVAAVNYNQIMHKQGDVATELVRDSIKMKEAGTNIAEMMDGMSGSASDLVSNYEGLREVREYLKATGLGRDVTRDMLAGAGGLEQLTSAFGDFIDMLPENQRVSIQTEKLRLEFARLGQVMPASKSGFTTLITSLVAGNAESQRLAGSLMQLGGKFNDLQSSYEELVSGARDGLSDAYEREVETLENTKKKFEDFGKSLRDFNKSLLTGGQSPLTLGQKYSELMVRYQDTLNLARGGDADAMAKFQTIANELLTVSREYNASGSAYSADFQSVLTDSAYLASVAQNQVDVATASLEALERQVDGLLEVNTSVMTVTEAITKLHAAMAQAGYATPVDGSHAGGLSNVPFNGYVAELHQGERVLTAAENKSYTLGNSQSNGALVSELKALTKEVATLRQEQAEQTGKMIASNYDANARAANSVVEGVEDAVSNSTRKEAVRPALN